MALRGCSGGKHVFVPEKWLPRIPTFAEFQRGLTLSRPAQGEALGAACSRVQDLVPGVLHQGAAKALSGVPLGWTHANRGDPEA